MRSEKPAIVHKEINLAGRPLFIETGQLASQATSAVLAGYGDTVVLATVMLGEINKEYDYFPLRVDYEERLYAGGKIKTSRFIKREGRPRDEAILNARLIDRAIRPLFAKDLRNEVQVIVTILSVDQDNDPSVLGLIATSAALMISGLPWHGPLGAVEVGLKEGGFFVNPINSDRLGSNLRLVMAGSKERVVMVEASAQEVSEEQVLSSIEFGQGAVQQIVDLVDGFQKELATAPKEYELEEVDPEVKEAIASYIRDQFPQEFFDRTKQISSHARDLFLDELYGVFEGKATKAEMKKIFDEIARVLMRDKVLKAGERSDGRAMDEVRPIHVQIGLLPRTHGSAVFQRGDTQVLTIATLGSTTLEQLIEGMTGEETKRYIHHYNFPPYSVGEVARLGAPDRREVGHGALAEKALLPVAPSEDEFPYTIRVVSEVLSSSSSSSMAAICGCSLALMDGGVPIKRPVSGVGMGLVKEGADYRILTDIQGIEDFYGDMDFKVAGTEKGITAIQMDIKIHGLTHTILQEALEKARRGRLHILHEMLKVIQVPRTQISRYAPKILTAQVDPKRIGEVIGPGGRIIRGIQEETETLIDIKEDGTVFISGRDEERVKQAQEKILNIGREIKQGEVFKGKVTRLVDFGAFVEILPNREGLVHISELSFEYVQNVFDKVKVGDILQVKVLGIDELGRINLSAKALMAPPRSSERGPGSQSEQPRVDHRRSGPRYRTPYHQKPSYKGKK